MDRVSGPEKRHPNPGEDDEMGRGRQRAKDAKIARQIKYANNGSDLRALERELVAGHSDVIPEVAVDDLEPEIDPIGEWDEDADDAWSDDAEER